MKLKPVYIVILQLRLSIAGPTPEEKAEMERKAREERVSG